MPHLVILYTANLEAELDAGGLCQTMAATMHAMRDSRGGVVFPAGGTRVLALAANHFAVSGGGDDHGFVYFNLRMGRGRRESVVSAVGQALTRAAEAHLAGLLARRPVGLTLHVDEGAEIFDARFGSLHATLRSKPG